MSQYRTLRKATSIAIQALKRNKLQTILTMIGMTIGVATVLTMIALGSGAQSAIQDQVKAAGMNIVNVTAGNFNMAQQWTNDGEVNEHPSTNDPDLVMQRQGQYKAGRGAADTLSLEDAAVIAKLPGVQTVSPGVADNALVKSGNTSWFTRVHGEGPKLPNVRRAWVFPHGHFFTQADVDKAADVVVLGSLVADHLFGAENPVGKTVTLHDHDYRVIGVIASSSWMVPAVQGDDRFEAVYMPVTTGQNLLARHHLDSLTISTISTGDVTRVSKDVTNLLRERHHISTEMPDDFIVSSQSRKTLAKGGMRSDITRAITGNANNLDEVTLAQLGKTLERASRTMTALLASIATVSLVVGGIGIMNIMLLSVTERTREIGTRRAVGARSVDVMHQFLMEAIVLSVGGGLLGIVTGIAVSGSITRFVQWSTSISPLSVAISFGVSAAVGILFGYYPAREASRVSPMTSLRYE